MLPNSISCLEHDRPLIAHSPQIPHWCWTPLPNHRAVIRNGKFTSLHSSIGFGKHIHLTANAEAYRCHMQTTELQLRCRLYSCQSRARLATVPTRCTDSSRVAARFPVAKSLFQHSSVQPYIHNCDVTLVEGCHIHHFCVFFKRHCYLPENLLLSSADRIFCEDAVVMRIGAGHQRAVVNMRSRDSIMADYMMKS